MPEKKKRIRYTAEIYRDEVGEWRWTVVAPNGRKMADSGEGYSREQSCRIAFAKLFGARMPLKARHDGPQA